MLEFTCNAALDRSSIKKWSHFISEFKIAFVCLAWSRLPSCPSSSPTFFTVIPRNEKTKKKKKKRERERKKVVNEKVKLSRFIKWNRRYKERHWSPYICRQKYIYNKTKIKPHLSIVKRLARYVREVLYINVSITTPHVALLTNSTDTRQRIFCYFPGDFLLANLLE